MASQGLQVTGYGNNSTDRNVFGFLTDEDLSSLIKYYAYDNDETFPTVDDLATADNEVLAGANSLLLSMVSLVDTSNAAPSSDWMPSGATGGEANPNRLQGDTSYVEQDGTILSAAGRATYNMVVEVPSFALTSMAFGFDLKIVYSYTGAVPTPKFQINIGTEGTPIWEDISETSSVYGILHTRTGSGLAGDGNYNANIPETGVELTVEAWADTSTTPS